jgi:hypothetical protein
MRRTRCCGGFERWRFCERLTEARGIMKAFRVACTVFMCLGGGVLAGTAANASAGIAGDVEIAFLDVASEPAARIVIDETDTGKTTPQPRIALTAGHHVLTLVTPDGAHRRTIGFSVEAGQTKTFKIHFAS